MSIFRFEENPMRIRFVVGLLLMVGLSSRAVGQERCDAILAKELLTDTRTQSKVLARAAQKADYCRREGKVSRSAADGDVEASYGLFSGDASYNQTQSDEFNKEDCGKNSVSAQNDEFRYYAQRALGEQVVTAWSNCMQNASDLNCYAQPPQPGANPIVHIVWRPRSRRQAFVAASHIQNGKNVDLPRSSGIVFASGSELLLGDQIVEISRNDPSTSTQARLSIKQDGSSVSCSVSIPPIISSARKAPLPVRDNLAARFALMRFAGLQECQKRRQQMAQLIGGSSPPTGFLQFATVASQVPQSSQASIDRERSARQAGNQEATISQFDMLERLSKSDGCLK